MKDIQVNIKGPGYLLEWLTHSYGCPVRFPRRSYENILLSSLLTKRGKHPTDDSSPDRIPVIIPCRCERPPEYYNYLSAAAERKFIQALVDIFKTHLWSDIFPLVHSRYALNASIENWCAAHGISIDNREAVRQCFYRMRQSHEAYGIILGKKYVKNL